MTYNTTKIYGVYGSNDGTLLQISIALEDLGWILAGLFGLGICMILILLLCYVYNNKKKRDIDESFIADMRQMDNEYENPKIIQNKNISNNSNNDIINSQPTNEFDYYNL